MEISRKYLLLGVCVFFSVFVLILMSYYNHAIPDYSYHIHKIWAVSEGHFLTSPFAGGLQLFKYGYPLCLFGAAIYPVFGELTLVVLSAVTLVLLFFASKKVYSHFVSDEYAKIGAFFSVMNPGTFAFLLGGTIPFLLGVSMGMASLGFFLENEMWKSFFLGIFTIIIHPLGIFVFLVLFFFKDMRDSFFNWFKVYFPSILLSLVILVQLFGLFSRVGFAGGPGIYSLLRVPFFLGVLFFTFLLKKKNRLVTGIFLVGALMVSLLSLVGFNFPMAYLLRPAFVIGLFLIPFLIPRWLETSSRNRKFIFGVYCFITLFSVLFQPIVAPGMQENLEEGNEVAMDVSRIVENEPVFLASRGEEFYELPRENVRFINTGVIRWDNVVEMEKAIEKENVSYVIYNEDFSPDNFENFSEIYQEDNFYLLESDRDNLK